MSFHFKILSPVFLALTIAVTVNAQVKTHAARIGRDETIPAEGIKIKLFIDSIPKPIPPATVEKLMNTKGEKFEVYTPEDLWVHDQYVGSWGGDQGTISIFKLSLPPPTDLKRIFRNFALKSDYDEWEKNVKPEWNDKSVAEWVSCFAGGKLKNPAGELLQRDIPKRNRITRFDCEDTGNSYRRLFLAENTDRPKDRYLIVYDLPRNTPLQKSEEAILQSVQSISFFTPKPASELTAILQPFKGKNYSPEYLESMERVIQGIRSLKGWKHYETENFILVTDLDNRRTISEIQEHLEKCHSIYQRYFPLKSPLREVSVCKVFEKRDEYLSYVSENIKWSTGIWMAGKRELVISPPVRSGTPSMEREAMADTVLHEAFHQYIFYASNENQSAPWFNEGNACYFQGADFASGNKVKIKLTRLYEPMKRLAASGSLKVEKLIDLDFASFYEGKEMNYPFSWGLMFFLWKGAAVIKSKNNYSEIPSKYYDTLIETKDGRKATIIAWAGVDMYKFNKDFAEFWRNDALIRRAEAFDPLEGKAKNLNR